MKFGEISKTQEYTKLDGQWLKWQTDIRHLGNYLNSAFDKYVDSNIMYSYLIGQFNNRKSKFGYMQPYILVIYLSRIVQIDLINVVHNGINRLGTKKIL